MVKLGHQAPKGWRQKKFNSIGIKSEYNSENIDNTKEF